MRVNFLKMVVATGIFVAILHGAARASQYLPEPGGVLHFLLVTFFGTPLVIPIAVFAICFHFFKEALNYKSIFARFVLIVGAVIASSLLDSQFNRYTDQVGRDLGKLSLMGGLISSFVLFATKMVSFARNRPS